MKPEQPSSSVGRGVGNLFSRTRALSASMTRWSRSAPSDKDAADVAVLPTVVSSTSGVPPATPIRTTSWKAKSSFRPMPLIKKPGNGKNEFFALVASRKLRNVRESKVVDLCDEKENLLSDVEFDNKGYSLDELQLAAVIMLERSAPSNMFGDKSGLIILYDFVDSVRGVYKPNPYHDFRHAVDVMQFMYHLLSREDIAGRLLKNPPPGFGDELKFLLLLACLCHDAGHDGMTNQIHRKLSSDLFQKYGAESTLEKLHYSHAENLFEHSEIWNILKETPGVGLDVTQFLNEIRSLILATDMEKHAALLATFKASPSAQLMNVLIKISDISNVMRNFDEAKVWAKRLEAEMKSASSRIAGTEAAAPPSSVPPPPLPQTVIGFSKIFALPLIDALIEAGFVDTGRELRARIEKNISTWETFSDDSFNPGL